jgi:hypothetical protein
MVKRQPTTEDHEKIALKIRRKEGILAMHNYCKSLEAEGYATALLQLKLWMWGAYDSNDEFGRHNEHILTLISIVLLVIIFAVFLLAVSSIAKTTLYHSVFSEVMFYVVALLLFGEAVLAWTWLEAKIDKWFKERELSKAKNLAVKTAIWAQEWIEKWESKFQADSKVSLVHKIPADLKNKLEKMIEELKWPKAECDASDIRALVQDCRETVARIYAQSILESARATLLIKNRPSLPATLRARIKNQIRCVEEYVTSGWPTPILIYETQNLQKLLIAADMFLLQKLIGNKITECCLVDVDEKASGTIEDSAKSLEQNKKV